MSPFGGTPAHSADMTSARWEAIGRFFANGMLEPEVGLTYGLSDMMVLAVIERYRGEAGGTAAWITGAIRSMPALFGRDIADDQAAVHALLTKL
jgi:hypothetical protein